MSSLANTPNLSAQVLYQEKTDDYAPSTSGFGPDGGKSSFVYLVNDADLDNAIVDVLGYTNPNLGYALGTSSGSGSGGLPGLLRKCPKSHPRWPWLYAAQIANIQGIGKPTKTIGNAVGEANPMVFYTGYPQYVVTIDFEPRPYYVLPDSQIPTGNVSWYYDDGSLRSNAYAQEWLRFTDFQITSRPEFITSQIGAMAYYTASGGLPGVQQGNSPSPLPGITFPGFLRMLVPQAELKITWYQVPYQFMESANSRLVSYVGYVNQTDWWRWKAGELLYTGSVAKKYTPPSPERMADPEAALAVSMPPKLCDVEMSFLVTRRVGTDIPIPPNGNWVPAGHNLMPWLKDRTFRYVAGGGAVNLGNSPPTYLSREFALLFSNPDS